MKTRVGPIMQVAYIVEDIDRAVADWGERLGVGPFFVRRNVGYSHAVYRGEPTAARVNLAFAYSGDLNIELIQLLDDHPSIFRTFVEERGYGVQHVGVLSDDIEGDTRRLAEDGIAVVQHMIAEDGVDTRLYDTQFIPGATLELIGRTPGIDAGFAMLKQAAAQWDGKSSLPE